VDIYQVPGSGPGGRISADDVRGSVQQTMQRLSGGAAAGTPGPSVGPVAQRPLPDFTRWGEVAREPLSRVSEITADAMSYTWSTIPMVTQYDRADTTELEAYRKRFNTTATPEAKLTTTAILLKVCAAALRAFPRFNSSLDGQRRELIVKQYIHIGVAVDTPAGLLVPVIRDVDGKGIEQLAVELNDLAAKTRERRMDPADLEGGSFTISNLGGIIRPTSKAARSPSATWVGSAVRRSHLWSTHRRWRSSVSHAQLSNRSMTANGFSRGSCCRSRSPTITG